ncbi:MAG TPA: peptide deformylase [Elusimicrobia bacterium]|nr:MAG: peptide deformylase [Elusimicrobia bacterium RIFOXYA12_FULL_49_49]OGS15265.1 MAG: peptide deformylase [Elusimicrobia bacterium RIFOXYA2_FULL_47_53]OGS26928.1 MAG: peptide deformylase [Elusimicrobia bacterium RIFOXYB12_FULL_50_12]OGS30520.1 MAG: peptide deformylase [Elusimicrobia bacterium RIFOXYB2_FULL_46_23]HBU69220.1 peptide deformylase [Elusimicrobiota bacterium]
MPQLKIIKYPDPLLKRKCKPVANIDADTISLINNMFETMYAAPGVGLAANQVGSTARICVIDVRPEGKRQPIVLINPKISAKSGRLNEEEGCLSFPGLQAKVKRYAEVKVEAVNENGMPIVVHGRGDLLSRALQHELDHLDGKVFIDYLPFWLKPKIKAEIRRLKKSGEWK